MKQRVITAIVALAVFIPILIFADATVFRICIALISALSAIEILSCVGCVKKVILSVPLTLFALLMPLFRSSNESLRGIVLVAVMFYCMATMVLSNGKINAGDVGISFTGVFFCTYSYECIAILREEYSWVFLLTFLAAWGSDTFAYFVGKTVGKHKLIPKISPKKTVEGAIGGAVGGMLLYPLFGLIISSTMDYSVNYILISILGFFAAVVSQIGDLIMSAVKRSYDVKDFGNIFPGHGGFLDRFDSTLTVAPLLCLALSVFKIIY